MSEQLKMKFDGETFDPEQDGERLSRQLVAVRKLMMDGEWRTLREIARAVKAPEASVSARLRDLRKEKFGAWNVCRQRVLDREGNPTGLWEYRVTTIAERMKEIKAELNIKDCEVKRPRCALE